MAIHPSFPASPYDVLNPDHRWFPADEPLGESSYGKLTGVSFNTIENKLMGIVRIY
jgi:type III restriction enzyme